MKSIDIMKYNLPGAILSVCKTENCIQHYCAGYADVETRESLSAEHIFRVGKSLECLLRLLF